MVFSRYLRRVPQYLEVLRYTKLWLKLISDMTGLLNTKPSEALADHFGF